MPDEPYHGRLELTWTNKDLCLLSYTQMLWTALKKKAAYLPGC